MAHNIEDRRESGVGFLRNLADRFAGKRETTGVALNRFALIFFFDPAHCHAGRNSSARSESARLSFAANFSVIRWKAWLRIV